MADETKTQIPKPTRRRGPMGRMGGMGRGEKAKDFKGTMRQLLGYIGQHKIAVFAAVAFAVCSVIFNIVGPKVLGQVTTKLFEGLVAKVNGTGDVDFDWIAKTLGFLLCLYLASSVCSLIQGWLMTGVTQKICYRMRKEIAAKIAVVPMSYFNGHSKGDVLSRITNDVDTLGQSLNQSVTQLITSVTQIIGVLVMMLSISLPLTGVTVLTLPAAAIILTVMIHFSQPYFREQQQVLGAVNGIIEEDFAGQNVIQVFDRAEASIEEFDRQNDRLFISGWRSQFLSGLMMPLMSLVGNMGYVGVVVVGAQLALTGNATPGDIQSFIQYVRNFTQPVQQLGNVSNTMQSMAAATERVFEFLAAPEEEQKADAQIPEKRPGHVVFDHVKFGYTPDKTIIHDFSCEAQPGQTIAIVGPTGAGKTTLVKLLQRFYDVDGGSLRVEGVDVRDWDRAALRGEFAMVLQDTWLFNGTIRENIRRERCRGRSRCARRTLRPLYSYARRRLRLYDQRRGHQSVAGSAPARDHRPRHFGRPSGADFGRGDFQRRYPYRGAYSARHGCADAGPHELCYRASPVHDPKRRRDPGDSRRRHRREGHARRAARPRRLLRRPVQLAVRRGGVNSASGNK